MCISHAGTPAGVDYMEVRERLLSIKGVKAVHNLHIWALTMNQVVLSAHVAIGEKYSSFFLFFFTQKHYVFQVKSDQVKSDQC